MRRPTVVDGGGGGSDGRRRLGDLGPIWADWADLGLIRLPGLLDPITRLLAEQVAYSSVAALRLLLCCRPMAWGLLARLLNKGGVLGFLLCEDEDLSEACPS